MLYVVYQHVKSGNTSPLSAVGALVCATGALDGALVGTAVGCAVGATVGPFVGIDVDTTAGTDVGELVVVVGALVGMRVGTNVGEPVVGALVGLFVGAVVETHAIDSLHCCPSGHDGRVPFTHWPVALLHDSSPLQNRPSSQKLCTVGAITHELLKTM